MVVNTGCFTTKELARIAETAGSSKAITTTFTTALTTKTQYDTTKAPVYTFSLYHNPSNSSSQNGQKNNGSPK